MKYSIAFFASSATSVAISGTAYDDVLSLARFADDNGFEGVWIPERHFHDFGGLFPNPSVLAAALAVSTQRVRIRAGSVVAPLHDPVRILEEWSMVDALSAGRVELAFASGWNADDFVFAPDRYADRRAQTGEIRDTVADAWVRGRIRAVNGVGRLVDLPVFPRPVQPALPVWVTSAGAPETLADAGRRGLPVLTHVVDQDISMLEDRLRVYREALDGRPGRVCLMLHTYLGTGDDVDAVVREPLSAYLASALNLETRTADHDGTGLEEVDAAAVEEMLSQAYLRYRDRSSLIGGLDACRERVRELEELGVDEIACLVDFGVPAPDLWASMERLRILVIETHPSEPTQENPTHV